MNRVLVLGGTGFIGTALIKKLVTTDCQITAVARHWEKKIEGVECIVGDIFDENFLLDILDNINIIYHLAWTTVPGTSNQSPIYDCETNQLGSLRILQAMAKKKVERIIFSSSGGAVYGIPENLPIKETEQCFPISAYGISKLAIERYLYLYSYLYGIKATVLRISNPFGLGQVPEKGQGVIATFSKRIINDEEIEIWGDGSVVRDFIYIDDVIDALVKAQTIDEPYALLNIGSGEGLSLKDIILELEKQFGKNAKVKYKPSRSCDVPAIILDIDQAKTVLGWEPRTDFCQGITKVLKFLN